MLYFWSKIWLKNYIHYIPRSSESGWPISQKAHIHTEIRVGVCGCVEFGGCAWMYVVIMVSVPAHHKIVHDAYIMNIISFPPSSYSYSYSYSLLPPPHTYVHICTNIFLWFSNSQFLIITISNPSFLCSSPVYLLIYLSSLLPSYLVF